MKTLYVEGLDCANCAAKLERALNKIEGINEVVIDFIQEKIVYESNFSQDEVIHKMNEVTSKVEPEAIITASKKKHEVHNHDHSHENHKHCEHEHCEHEHHDHDEHHSHSHHDHDHGHSHGGEQGNIILWRIGISSVIFLMTYLFKFPEMVEMILLAISYLIIGYDIVYGAIKNLFKGRLMDENFLMSIATFGAMYVQEFHEAVAVMLFYQVGEYYQDKAVSKSRNSITELMDLRPDYANIKKNGEIEKVNPDELQIGDVIVVYPGEKIPVDGRIIEGSSTLDTSMLTGESLPKDVEVDQEVLSGCVNLTSILTIEVQKEFADSTSSKILDMVENAGTKKAKIENFITKFARYYTPIVVSIAVVIAIVPPLIITNATFSEFIYRACIFLVISCPCALVISVPLSFFAGIGAAGKQGILLKGGNYLEALTKLSTVVFDKTGTLTEGKFEVVSISNEGISDSEVLKMAAHLEANSHHPIAVSIVESYNGKIDKDKVSKVKEISGYGLSGEYGSQELLVGNKRLFEENKIIVPNITDSGTVVYVGYDAKYVGHIVIKDKVKVESKTAINELKRQGLKTIMLTGDKKEVGEMVSSELGIEEVYTELLPQDKVEIVEELLGKKNAGEMVAFVGDGMNDAPVLARVDVGIAMGQVGSDAAIEVADVVIMKDDISKIAVARNIAQKTMQIVKQNIVFALTIKLLFLVLGAIGVANMWLAVFADVGVAVIAIINATRILKN